MRTLSSIALLLSLACGPAFAQSAASPAPPTSAPSREAAAAEIAPSSAPAPAPRTATAPSAGSFQGSGLLLNGNAMLGIHSRAQQ